METHLEEPTPFPADLEEYYADFDTWVRGGRTPSEAAAALGRMLPDAEDVRRVAEEYDRRNRRFIDMTDPRVLREDRRIETWYGGPDFRSAWCWPSYKQLLVKKRWDQEGAIGPLDQASTKILAHLPHPRSPEIRTRGLVVGYVQSGKTASYSALIAKAADVGYKLFIVLAGMTSSLRRQTQRRLEDEICLPNSQNWHMLTQRDQDFREFGHPDALLNPENARTRILCVVKKNVHILRRLREFFERAQKRTLHNCPVIVIDDEADQASVNTAKRAARRSAINRRIVQLLQALPKAAYIGYTATPFANIFIDPEPPEDLYPRDFIFSLDRPVGYFGAEKIFGRERIRHDDDDAQYDGLDIVREVIDPDDVAQLQPKRDDRFDFEPACVESLQDAIAYFLMATACRRARGQQGHSTMLLHTTLYTYTHEQMQGLVLHYLSGLSERLTREDAELLSTMRNQWDLESKRVRGTDLIPEIPETPFDDVLAQLATVLERCDVVVDNGTLKGSLDYGEGGDSKVYVAVGGNTLSRGLTLEGLVVSYFIRAASAYDTLLQMGRWFGFRRGYEDLPRMWMTPDLEGNFMHLAVVEKEIRYDIRRYIKEGRTPLDFGVRVRTHPRLRITSRLKMQNVKITSASYADQREQTFLFRISDASWLAHNVASGRRLIAGLIGAGVIPRKLQKAGSTRSRHRWIMEGAPADHILRFIDDYRFHEDHDTLDPALLRRYIEAENQAAEPALRTWNVVVLGRGTPRDALGELELGLPSAVPCINRSRYKVTEPESIKALTSRPDRIVDLDLPADTQTSGLEDDALAELRNQHSPGTGLLLLYPISKDSAPEVGKVGECPICKKSHRLGRTKGPPVRHPLAAKEHVLGVAIVFPASASDLKDYVVGSLGSIFDGSDLQADDPEDEIATAIFDADEDDAEVEG